MKTTVLTIFSLLLIGAGLAVFTTRPDRVIAQVKIEPGKTPTPKPTSPNPPPRRSGGESAAPHRVAPEIEMVYVPGGDFLMGSPDNEPGRSDTEGPQRRVTVLSFYIGKYEVTQAQWRAVMGRNPSRFRSDNLPVEQVSWNDAKDFCHRLSQMTGREYRLPTEAEWEYACRAKTTGAYAGDLGAMAWYLKNSDLKTHPVGQKLPNEFGLYDMHGNVEEWCEDQWHRSYVNAPTDGRVRVDISAKSSGRVIRGGCSNSRADYCRSATRLNSSPDFLSGSTGFRLVRAGR